MPVPNQNQHPHAALVAAVNTLVDEVDPREALHAAMDLSILDATPSTEDGSETTIRQSSYRLIRVRRSREFEPEHLEIREVSYLNGEISSVSKTSAYIGGKSPEEIGELLKRIEFAMDESVIDLPALVARKKSSAT